MAARDRSLRVLQSPRQKIESVILEGLVSEVNALFYLSALNDLNYQFFLIIMESISVFPEEIILITFNEKL